MSGETPNQPAGLRIGIDGLNLAMARGTGIATYARVLSHCLTGMGHKVDVLYGLPIAGNASPMMREVNFFDRLEQPDLRSPKPLVTRRWWDERGFARCGCDACVVPVTGLVDRRSFRMPSFDRVLNIRDLFPMAARHFRRQGRFLRVRIPDPPAIMHWTYPLPIVLEGAGNIYTIHDMVPLRLPHTTLDNKDYHVALIRGCIAEADALCTVSEASRADIVRCFPEAAPKLTNTYEAIEELPSEMHAGVGLADVLGGLFGLERDGYFLFFGSLEPKKNIGRLLEAYLSAGTATPLVIVGARAWRADQELALLNLRGQAATGGPLVRQLDYLPSAMLRQLIQGARAVLFPSLCEGFGLPVLEAMALGVPALTSTEGALPEVAGEAALLVDPYNTAALSRAISQLDKDADLRARLAGMGPVQAERFSAARYCERLTDLYRSVLRIV